MYEELAIKGDLETQNLLQVTLLEYLWDEKVTYERAMEMMGAHIREIWDYIYDYINVQERWKINMKKLFQAIRNSDIDTVKQLLEKKPELISCTAKQPPKKDDGQSPLQVALKTGNFEIANYLLDLGADVNFMEDDTCCNEWRAPVIHDAIVAAVMNSRWNVNSPIYGGLKKFSTKEKADVAYQTLERIIGLGADVNAKDSYGVSCLWRFCSQARQILPTYNHVQQKLLEDRIFTSELKDDLSRIFCILQENGMDLEYIAPSFSCSAKEMYGEEPVGYFFNLRG